MFRFCPPPLSWLRFLLKRRDAQDGVDSNIAALNPSPIGETYEQEHSPKVCFHLQRTQVPRAFPVERSIDQVSV